ncbi:hypothetical protein C1637_10070 [Chryseobacterium lactis]|uniref:Uncharacterized protein n=2 Tax=Chryseobacterium TaxID=59732 RepID=A0A3G6RKG0_CHRLC|nr:hypothetical protein [Chryseobacterium lactis]AZA82143.1 hypothetical protein EG342_09625 [Chryseobacterium lactis]AZB02524.1 hypothetical protein EG341_00480 [Chryseobacterium lactis]PNW14180.1 hypothetical protein C1637_10070 [Chryseobacterium lactis]
MNELEISLQQKTAEVMERKKTQGYGSFSEEDIFRDVFLEKFVDIIVIKRDSPSQDISEALEACVYAEARSKGYSPESAVEETAKFMEQEKLKNSNP